MAGSYTNYKIKKFLIISHDEKTVINMTETQASVQYFEDIFSPAIFLRLVVVDTQGLLTSLPSTDSKIKPGLKGGEQVVLTIEQTETKQVIDINETTNPYYIYKISGSTTQSTKEMFVIDIAPLEVFSNETTRVFRRYPESSGSKQTIDQSVEQILTGVLKTTKKRNIDATKNSYHFFGNSKKPFTVLTCFSRFGASFFFLRSCDAADVNSFSLGLAAVEAAPVFFAAARACAAFLLSSFAAASCLSLAEPLS